MTSPRAHFLASGGTLSRPLDAARLKVLAWRAVLENVYPQGIGERVQVATYTDPAICASPAVRRYVSHRLAGAN